MSTLKPVAVALATTIVTLASGGSASAISSTITITQATFDQGGGVTVRGKVESPRRRCERGRTVEVYHDVPPLGQISVPPDFKLGEVPTNDNGGWRLSTDFNPDRVIARVKKRGTCAADTSPTKTVTAP